MANHGPAYGLSKEIQMKNQARFVLEEAQQILEWIALGTGIPLAKDPHQMNSFEVAEALKDGIQLCS
ncbi:hypothetical protein D918_07898 [Trichuris suis]|nr:hypothetical protein D918_07898 [Trichuris suis]